MTYFDADFAAGSMHELTYCSEATFGTIPATGSMIALRYTSCSLQLAKDTFQSQEIRSDRQITDFRHGTHRLEGDIGFEFSWNEFDTLLEGGFCGTWQTLMSVAGTDIATKTTGKLLYSATTTFTSFATGDCIYVSGFTGSGLNTNGVHIVTGAKPLTLTLGYSTLASEAAGDTVNVKRLSSLKTGTTERSFTFERGYTDIDLYERMAGCIINGIDFTMKPNAIVTGTLRMMGRSTLATGSTMDTTPTASQSDSPYDTFSGAIKEAGVAVAYVTSVDFKLENGGENTFVIGSKYTQKIVLGRCNITGTLEVFLEDSGMINKFINETASYLEFDVGGTDEYYKFFIPNIKFGAAEHPVDREGPIVLRMPFQAVYSATYGFTAQITRVDI